MSFSGLIGNNKIKETLIESVKSQNILHSYMFYGIEGIGKKLFAMEFAKMVLCEGENKPCNECKPCIEFNSGNNPDFFYMEPEKDSIKIDQIRNIQKNIIEKPINGSKKIYIIDNADKMTKEAQNCLLKTLEEPQDFVVIILICSNESSILPTVKSRCTKIYFNGLSKNEIVQYVKDNNIEIDINDDLIDLCDGSISKLNNIIEKESILEEVRNLIDLIDKINQIDFLTQSTVLYENREDIELMLEYIYTLLFKKVNS